MERIYFTDVSCMGVIQFPFQRGGQIEKDNSIQFDSRFETYTSKS